MQKSETLCGQAIISHKHGIPHLLGMLVHGWGQIFGICLTFASLYLKVLDPVVTPAGITFLRIFRGLLQQSFFASRLTGLAISRPRLPSPPVSALLPPAASVAPPAHPVSSQRPSEADAAPASFPSGTIFSRLISGCLSSTGGDDFALFSNLSSALSAL